MLALTDVAAIGWRWSVCCRRCQRRDRSWARDIARERLRRAVEIGERIGPPAERVIATALANLAVVTDDHNRADGCSHARSGVDVRRARAPPHRSRPQMAAVLSADPSESTRR